MQNLHFSGGSRREFYVFVSWLESRPARMRKLRRGGDESREI